MSLYPPDREAVVVNLPPSCIKNASSQVNRSLRNHGSICLSFHKRIMEYSNYGWVFFRSVSCGMDIAIQVRC